jgi:hypothetical protein
VRVQIPLGAPMKHQWTWLKNGWAIHRFGCGDETIALVAETGSEIYDISTLNMRYCPDERPNWMNGSEIKGQ